MKSNRTRKPQSIGEINASNRELFPYESQSTYKDIIHAASQPPRKYNGRGKVGEVKIARFKMTFYSQPSAKYPNGKKIILPSLERKRVDNKLVIDEQAALIKLLRLATGTEANKWGKYLKAAYIYMSLDETPLVKSRSYNTRIISLFPTRSYHDFEENYGELPFKDSNVNLDLCRELIDQKI